MQSFEHRLDNVNRLIQEGDVAGLQVLQQEISNKNPATEEDNIVLTLLDKNASNLAKLYVLPNPSSFMDFIRNYERIDKDRNYRFYREQLMGKKLQKAVKRDDKERVKFLLDLGADPYYGIVDAIIAGNVEILKLLYGESMNNGAILRSIITEIIHLNRIDLLHIFKDDINELKEREEYILCLGRLLARQQNWAIGIL
jgi:hypothetical protein